MAVDQDALADVVVMTVKSSLASAMAPVLERLAVAEARLAAVPNVEKVIGDIRDRVLTVETKALVQPVVVASAEPVDLAPVLADVKSLQTQIAGWESRWNDLGTLRERVAVVEAKELPSVPDPVAPVDLNPLFQRLAVAEHKLAALPATEQALGAMRDRMVAVETKAAMPLGPDAAVGELSNRLTAMETTAAIPTAAEIMLSDVKSRLTALETRPAPEPVMLDQKAVDLTPVEQRLSRVELGLEMKVAEITPVLSALADHTKDLGAIRERLAVVEREDAGVDLAPVEQRLSRLELELEMKVADTAPVLAALADHSKDIGAIRERLAVAETRAGVPGPQGQDGKAGADGFGLEDFSVDFDGDRTFALKFERGALKKTAAFQLPFQRYQGVFQEGKTYTDGDVVTWAGSTWHALEETSTKPGDGSKSWVLSCKRGRDGRDGKDAAGALPVVAVGSRS